VRSLKPMNRPPPRGERAGTFFRRITCPVISQRSNARSAIYQRSVPQIVSPRKKSQSLVLTYTFRRKGGRRSPRLEDPRMVDAEDEALDSCVLIFTTIRTPGRTRAGIRCCVEGTADRFGLRFPFRINTVRSHANESCVSPSFRLEVSFLNRETEASFRPRVPLTLT